jgi:hypothetical protein
MSSAAPEEPVDPADELMFLCLGGGNEVGRSCHIIQYKGKTVMVRCCVVPRHQRSLGPPPFSLTFIAPARSWMLVNTRPMTG